MGNDESRSGYNPSLPWHIQTQRNGRWYTVETFETAAEVIRYVGELPDPKSVNVFHTPTMRDGNGESFLRSVNNRMGGK